MRRIGIGVLSALVLLALTWTMEAARGPWPEYRRDATRQASQNVSVPIDPLSFKWTTEIIGGGSQGGVTLGPNKTLFVKGIGGEVGGTPANVVYCIDTDTGAIKWETVFSPANQFGYGGVCVGTDRVFATIYNGVGDPATKTVALDIDTGAILWENLDAQGPRGTPALGWIPNSAGNLNIYMHDRNGDQLMAIDSVTGVTEWTVPTAADVGAVLFGHVGPLWEEDGKIAMFVTGDKGNAVETGMAVRDNLDGTYTVLWTGGPVSKNWKGSGLLNLAGTRILHSAYWDAGAQTAWVLDIADGRVISSARDVNAGYPRPALSPDGATFYVTGSDIGGEGGALAAYQLDAKGCLEKKWQVNGMGGEITSMTVIDGFAYCADNAGRVWVVQDLGSHGRIVRDSLTPISLNAWFGGAMQVVVDEEGYGYAVGNSRLGFDPLPVPNPNTRHVYAFNRAPLTAAESGVPTIVSISKDVTLAWGEADPAMYRVWRADAVTGPFAPISDTISVESYTDGAPPADQAFYKVEWLMVAPETVVAFYDFEDGDQGWTHSGNVDDWELGTPVDHTFDRTAPDGAHSGTNAWGTKLAGDYSPNSDSILRSPSFTLGEGKTGTLRFHMWLTSEVGVDEISVRIRRASDDESLLDLITNFSTTTTGLDCWPGYSYALPGLGGTECYVEFHFQADDSLEYPGVYIDNVEIVERD